MQNKELVLGCKYFRVKLTINTRAKVEEFEFWLIYNEHVNYLAHTWTLLEI